MFLDLSRMHGGRERVDRTYPAGSLDAADEFTVASPVVFGADVHKDKDRYRLVGTVRATLRVSCSRCLEEFEIPLDTPFDLRYVPASHNEGEGELEVQEDDLNTAYYRDEIIDLGQLMREQFYLALPMKPLCREDCAGLCPVCGANRNRVSCDCAPLWEDPRLAALKQLIKRETEN